MIRQRRRERKKKENNQSYSSVSILLPYSSDCHRVIFEMYAHQWMTPGVVGMSFFIAYNCSSNNSGKKERKKRRSGFTISIVVTLFQAILSLSFSVLLRHSHRRIPI